MYAFFRSRHFVLTISQAVIDLLNTADDSEKVPDAAPGQHRYRSHKHDARGWELLRLILDVIEESARVQQAFSSEKYPSVPKILPAYAQFRHNWAALMTDPKYALLHYAIGKGVKKIDKYYSVAKQVGANAISLCERIFHHLIYATQFISS